MTETPAAQKRGSSSAPGIWAANSAGKAPCTTDEMRAHLLEQPAAQHRHTPAAARRAARVGASPRLDREPARPRRPGARELVLQAPPSPRRSAPGASRTSPARGSSAGRRPSGARSFTALVSRRTRAIRRSTCSTGVSGRTPWPRLKICARVSNPLSTRSMSSSSAGRRRPAPADRDCPARRQPFGQRGDGDPRVDARCRGRSRRFRRCARIFSAACPRRAERR